MVEHGQRSTIIDGAHCHWKDYKTAVAAAAAVVVVAAAVVE
jgi:hypothetical protein